jgi:predicted aminopeptidase
VERLLQWGIRRFLQGKSVADPILPDFFVRRQNPENGMRRAGPMLFSGVSLMRRRVLRLLGVAFVVAVLATVLSGCQTVSYYKQAIRGQYQIFANRQPIDKLLASTNTPPDLKAKFRLVMDLRRFAEKELKLPVDGHYSRYVDVKRRFVVWNVHAAKEFSLEPKTWRYPVVGRLKYRGFFSEADAKRYGRKLQEEGLDVYLDGVEAYSTLGWFKDPILNTFIHHGETELADILFHELAHQRVFAAGDTDFNEAFATTVAEEAVHRWFKDRPALLEEFRVQQGREEDFVHIVLTAREALKRLYAHTNESPAALRHQKLEAIEDLRREYAKLRQEWGGYSSYDSWFSRPINNAQLNTVATYHHFVPAFRALLRTDGGDLQKFYRDVKSLANLPKQERHRRLLLNREMTQINNPLQQDGRANDVDIDRLSGFSQPVETVETVLNRVPLSPH